MLGVADIIKIAKVSQYLSEVAIRKNILIGGNLDPRLPVIIYDVRKDVEFMYDMNPSEPSLVETSNYLYWLCGEFALQAQYVIAQGGGGTIVNPTGAQTSIAAILVQFIVGVSDMNAGDTVYILNYQNIINGTVSIELDGSELPVNLSTQISYNIVYTSTSATITFNQPVFNGQLFVIRGLRFTV